MLKSNAIWKGLMTVAVLGLVLAACGTGATTTPAPTQPPQDTKPTEAAPPPAEKKVTSSGFECPEPNPKMEVTSKTLNLYVWTEYIPQDHIDCFELVYGVTVNREEYSSNEEMYAKLSAGSTGYDLAQPTDYIISLMIRQGLLQKLDKSQLPNFKNFDPSYLDQPFDPGNEYTVPYQAGMDAIVVNAANVENVPQSWADLWKPEYAGRMVFLDDSRAIIGLTLITLGYDPNTKDAAQLEEAKVKLADLVAGVKLFDSDSPKTALISKDVDLGVVWTAEALLAQQEVPTIEFVYPTEGAILWQDNYVIPVGAAHIDAAYAWINYTMQDDLFWLMLSEFPYINPNKATLDWAKTHQPDLYNTYMDSPITNVPEEAITNGHRIEDVGDALPLYDKIWTEVKGGQ
jgi:spermidine/putrescine-binding protein